MCNGVLKTTIEYNFDCIDGDLMEGELYVDG
jgi:hypothetical protein